MRCYQIPRCHIHYVLMYDIEQGIVTKGGTLDATLDIMYYLMDIIMALNTQMNKIRWPLTRLCMACTETFVISDILVIPS